MASKFALEGLTDTLRLELRGSGIHVSLIEPGPIVSRFPENAHRAFKAHVDAERSLHREAYGRAEERLAKKGPAQPFTLPPEAVLRKLIHALESPDQRSAITLRSPPTSSGCCDGPYQAGAWIGSSVGSPGVGPDNH